MKKSIYDDPVFFEKYSQMNRSVQGLAGAGEWETLEPMLPDFEGKRVADLGCGYGWHCIYAADHKADFVVGIDSSEKMLEVAREKSQGRNIEYRCMALENMGFEDESFDIVLSSLVLHYVQSFEAVAREVCRVMKKGGNFIFTVEHPVFTAYGTQDWYYDEEGNILHFPVDRYFYEGERKAVFLGEEVTKYHKTLTTYLSGLLRQGFEILDVQEPKPPKNMIDTVEGMRDEMRRPMMLIVSARKR